MAKAKYPKGFKNNSEYQDHLAKQKGFKNNYEYNNLRAQQKGFKNFTEYNNLRAQQKGFKNHNNYSDHKQGEKILCKAIDKAEGDKDSLFYDIDFIENLTGLNHSQCENEEDG